MNGNKKNNGAPKRGLPKQNRAAAKGFQAGLGAARGNPPRGVGAPAGARQGMAAAAYATGQKSQGPRVVRTSVDSCRIVHRELIASVTGTVAFTVAQSFALNPGIATTFPWLANEALGWERYKFQKLRFCYYTRTGSNIPGSVLLAPDYDAADPAPVSEQAASSYRDCEEDAPWKDIKCMLTSADLNGPQKERYIRSGSIAANQDIKTYDSGTFHLCTVDGTAVSWGKLWVEYDVILYTPQVPPGGFPGVGIVSAAGGSIAAATPLGAVPVSSGQFNLAGAATNVVSFSNLVVGQTYELIGALTGTVISANAFGTAVGGTLSNTRSSMFNAAATNAMNKTKFVATASVGSVTWSVTATTVTAASVWMATSPLGNADAS